MSSRRVLRRGFGAVALAAVMALGCGGSLVDADGVVSRGSDGGDGGGFICAQDNQCLCDPCQSNHDCATGLQCQDAKNHGTSCGIRVCLAPGA